MALAFICLIFWIFSFLIELANLFLHYSTKEEGCERKLIFGKRPLFSSYLHLICPYQNKGLKSIKSKALTVTVVRKNMSIH